MAIRHNHATQPSDPDMTQEWHDSQTLFLLTCYDVWSATPSRHCAVLFDDDGTA